MHHAFRPMIFYVKPTWRYCRPKKKGTVAVVYQSSHDAEHRRRVTLVAELRKALVGEGLTLHYQPLVNMTDGLVIGFEALLRWSHSTLGNISPAELVPLAERASVLPDFSKFILDIALANLGGGTAMALKWKLLLICRRLILQMGNLARVS